MRDTQSPLFRAWCSVLVTFLFGRKRSMTMPHHKIPILTTFEAPPGFVIGRVLGPCWGITVRSRSVIGTACAGCQQIFGGEISALTQLATESRNEAMHRLELHAIEQG